MKIYIKSAAFIGLALVLVTAVAAAQEAIPNRQVPVTSPQYPSLPNDHIELVSRLAGTANTVAVQGDYAYIGEKDRLIVVDIKKSGLA